MRFDQAANNLNPNLTEQQRMQQIMQLRNQFNQEFSPFVDTTFTDPQLRQRFNQLDLQFQGLDAFRNPQVRQQLDLTPEQQRQIRTLNAEWRRQVQRLQRAGNENNASLTHEQFLQLQQQLQNRLNSVLTPQQQQDWTQLTGRPVPLPAEWVFGQFPDNAAGVVPKSNGTNANTNGQSGVVQPRSSQSPAGGTAQGNQNQGGNQGTLR
jgi:hypothetical protein